jgi:hypothetical protein
MSEVASATGAAPEPEGRSFPDDWYAEYELLFGLLCVDSDGRCLVHVALMFAGWHHPKGRL